MELWKDELENSLSETKLNTVRELITPVSIWEILKNYIAYVVYIWNGEYAVLKCIPYLSKGNVFLYDQKGTRNVDWKTMHFYTEEDEANALAMKLNSEPKDITIPANECRDIYCILTQKWDKNGTEVKTDITSFVSEESACSMYEEWLGYDKSDSRVKNLEETEGQMEYYYNKDEELYRCKVINSTLFNQ